MGYGYSFILKVSYQLIGVQLKATDNLNFAYSNENPTESFVKFNELTHRKSPVNKSQKLRFKVGESENTARGSILDSQRSLQRDLDTKHKLGLSSSHSSETQDSKRIKFLQMKRLICMPFKHWRLAYLYRVKKRPKKLGMPLQVF